MSQAFLTLNGIDATTGDYTTTLTEEQLLHLAKGQRLESQDELVLLERKQHEKESHYGVADGFDPMDLASSGWGVIFPWVAPSSPEQRRQEAIREALRPLLQHRREHANREIKKTKVELYHEFVYEPSETAHHFLLRVSGHRVSSGPVDPLKGVPYYLLLVGSPEEIPFEFQYQLGVQFAVGRLDLDTVEAFAWYARSVLAVEKDGLILPRRAAFFGVQNDHDRATELSTSGLVTPLFQHTQTQEGPHRKVWAGWQVEKYLGEQAHRNTLEGLMSDAPALLFTASHGMSFPNGHALQQRHQGALLCQDWPGPEAWRRKPIPEEFYFAGEHLKQDSNLTGSMVFMFACFGAGTPQKDQFFKHALDQQPRALANVNFTAALPKALLGREKGGALAVIGHVDRAWSCSFRARGAGSQNDSQLTTFESTLRKLAKGVPVGAALEDFDSTYAEQSVKLTECIHKLDIGRPISPYELAGHWTSNNDARGYVLLGDPAVSLHVQSADAPARPREKQPLSLSQETLTALARLTAATPADPVTSEMTPASSPESAPEHSSRATTPPPSSATAPASEEVSFGWLGGDKYAAPTPKPPSVFERLVSNLGEKLGQALEDASRLEIKTYTADSLQHITFQNGQPEGAELRALTRIALDGDIVSCVPTSEGEIHKELWEVHLQLVKQAQETRTELLRTLLNAASALVKLGG